MTRIATIILLSGLWGLSGSALAEDDRASLFACGIKFGNTQLTYSVPAEPREKKEVRSGESRLQYVAGALQAEPLKYIPPRSARTTKTEKRLPRKFTFATVGCSWR